MILDSVVIALPTIAIEREIVHICLFLICSVLVGQLDSGSYALNQL